jgi:hypothetical protein
MFHRFLTALAVAGLGASCATSAPAPAPPPPAAVSSPPAGSQRLPGSLACESEIGCAACADDNDRETVRLAFLVHAAEVRACYGRAGAPPAGTEKRVTFRVAIDPSGAAGTSCIVRTFTEDTDVERCVADLVLTWKVPPRKNGDWALVDAPFTFRGR